VLGMIAQQLSLHQHESARPSALAALPSLSLQRVATLQVILATRRAARTADHAVRYNAPPAA
jgi:hypothetical protein